MKNQVGGTASIKNSKPVKENNLQKKKLPRSRSKFFSRVKSVPYVLPQGYSYEEQPDDFTKIVFTTRTAETRESAEIYFIGRIAWDFFSCDRILISGVTLRISFLRNRPENALVYDDETKDYKIEIIQTILYVRKMTVSDNVYSNVVTYCHTQNVPRTISYPERFSFPQGCRVGVTKM